MTGTDPEGHFAWQNGKPLPGLCHCAMGEAHTVEPTVPTDWEAYGWSVPALDCPVTGGPQIDRDDLDMCPCGHRHIRITGYGGGGSG